MAIQKTCVANIQVSVRSTVVPVRYLRVHARVHADAHAHDMNMRHGASACRAALSIRLGTTRGT